jgi:hypothetical protein
MNELQCDSCGTRIKIEGVEVTYVTSQCPPEKRMPCRFGFHKFKSIGHLYENHKQVAMAIYQECQRCGYIDSRTVKHATLDRISK